jgi:hypothetical protein
VGWRFEQVPAYEHPERVRLLLPRLSSRPQWCIACDALIDAIMYGHRSYAEQLVRTHGAIVGETVLCDLAGQEGVDVDFVAEACRAQRRRERWGLVRALVRRRRPLHRVFYAWLELHSAKVCAPGGAGRKRDRAAFLEDFGSGGRWDAWLEKTPCLPKPQSRV